MSQIALPAQDFSNSGWTPSSGYFQLLRKASPDDSTYDATTGSLPEGATLEVKLDSLAWPDTTQPGPWQLTVRLRQTDTSAGSSSSSSSAAAVPVTVTLLQGTTTIASHNFSASASFANYVLTLTVAQVASITDYTNLYVLIKAGIATTTGCSECIAAPVQWKLVASGFTGVCAGLNDSDWTLTYIGSCMWSSSSTITFPSWRLVGSGGTWQLIGLEPNNLVSYQVIGTFACMGTNTFGSPTGSCPSPPATLTISPI